MFGVPITSYADVASVSERTSEVLMQSLRQYVAYILQLNGLMTALPSNHFGYILAKNVAPVFTERMHHHLPLIPQRDS